MKLWKWPRRRYQKIRAYMLTRRNAQLVTNRGVQLLLDDPIISSTMRRVIYEDKYEKEEVSILRETLKPDDVLMELGAGMGFISTFAAQRIGGNNVHAFEANPDLKPLIERNYAQNNVKPFLHQIMLVDGDASDEYNFHVAPDFWASSAVHHEPGSRTISVPTASFIQTIEEIEPTYLVVDIEGGERELFSKSMDFGKVRHLLIELHPQKIGAEAVAQVVDGLKSSGFVKNKKLSKGKVVLMSRNPNAGERVQKAGLA